MSGHPLNVTDLIWHALYSEVVMALVQLEYGNTKEATTTLKRMLPRGYAYSFVNEGLEDQLLDRPSETTHA